MPHNYEDLKQVYARLGLELARQALLERALLQAREGVARSHHRLMGELAPHVAYPEVAETYLEEAMGGWQSRQPAKGFRSDEDPL